MIAPSYIKGNHIVVIMGVSKTLHLGSNPSSPAKNFKGKEYFMDNDNKKRRQSEPTNPQERPVRTEENGPQE